MKWLQTIEDYKYHLKIEKALAENSVNSYVRDIKKLIAFLEENNIKKSPTTINEIYLQDFIYQISKEISPRSQARLISGLRNFFNFLVFEGYRTDNPTELIEAPKVGRKLPNVLTIEEIDTLISGIDLSNSIGERNRTIIETLYSCGLRVSELINLKISDLFFDEEFIRVSGKGNKQRFVPINQRTQKFINIYIHSIRNQIKAQKASNDVLFLNRRGKKLSREMIFIIIKQLTEKVGLQKKVSPHTFRHSFATHLLQSGANLRAIQQMLGHDSITTTEIYTHLDNTFLKEMVINHHPRNK